MKFLKQYNGFILERYNQLTKFYHVTSKDNLNSLLKGIDITLSKDRGQGSGFYVVTDLEAAENTKVTLGFGSPGFKVCDLLIEIESVFLSTSSLLAVTVFRAVAPVKIKV